MLTLWDLRVCTSSQTFAASCLREGLHGQLRRCPEYQRDQDPGIQDTVTLQLTSVLEPRHGDWSSALDWSKKDSSLLRALDLSNNFPNWTATSILLRTSEMLKRGLPSMALIGALSLGSLGCTRIFSLVYPCSWGTGSGDSPALWTPAGYAPVSIDSCCSSPTSSGVFLKKILFGAGLLTRVRESNLGSSTVLGDGIGVIE